MKRKQEIIDTRLLYHIEREGNTYHILPLNDPLAKVETVHIKALRECEELIKEIETDYNDFLNRDDVELITDDRNHHNNAIINVPLKNCEDNVLRILIKDTHVDSFGIISKNIEKVL
jgi:hypothetical protein